MASIISSKGDFASLPITVTEEGVTSVPVSLEGLASVAVTVGDVAFLDVTKAKYTNKTQY